MFRLDDDLLEMIWECREQLEASFVVPPKWEEEEDDDEDDNEEETRMYFNEHRGLGDSTRLVHG